MIFFLFTEDVDIFDIDIHERNSGDKSYRTGTGNICIGSREDLEKCLLLNKQYLGPRYIDSKCNDLSSYYHKIMKLLLKMN